MPSLAQIKSHLAEHGVSVLEVEEPTPTSEAAARALGCSAAEIAKTVLFLVGGAPVAVVASGDVRVKGSWLKQALAASGKVRLPSPGEVERHTGYAPGGVCPFLLPPGLPVVVDVSLKRFPVVYAAAGNDHSAVPIAFERLVEITAGRAAQVCEPLAQTLGDAPQARA